MAKAKVKILVAVQIEKPDNSTVSGVLKGKELNDWLRDRAEADVRDALVQYNLSPEVLRVRVARDKD